MGKRKRTMKIEASENETNGDVKIEQKATDVEKSQPKKVCTIWQLLLTRFNS